MALTLTEASSITKRGLVFGSIFLTVVLFAWAGIWFWYYKIYLPSLPPPKEVPTMTFGKLPKLALPKQTADSSKMNFALDTATGTVDGKYPEIIKIYSIAQVATDLLALDKAKDLALSMGFKGSQQAISNTEYKFTGLTGGDIKIKLNTGNFELRRPIATESADFDDREYFLNSERLGQDFKSYLGAKGLLNESLKNGRVKVMYDKSRGEANKAFINIWQADIDEKPIVSDTYSEALVKGLVTNYREESKKYVFLAYTYWPIDMENFSTYPIKTPQQAFEDLQRGKAMVPFSSKSLQVSITKVYLGYYLPLIFTDFLQPVYVFEGPEFAAYVQAVKDEWIE